MIVLYFIKISNTYNGKLTVLGGKLYSRKTDDGLHGLGIESVQYAVEKYNGVLEYDWKEDIFIVNISLFS